MQPVPPPPDLDASGVDRAIERLRVVTREKGLRNSSAREEVARVALERQGHFSVDDLAAALRSRSSNAHRATVYRVLPLLVEAGLLQITLISRGDGARYERSFERAHHDHLICTVCGKVVEFHLEAIEVLQQDLANKLGFRLTDHVHELLGVCAGCDSHSASD